VTDADLVKKKLALIETYVRELVTLANPARTQDDLREERFVEHTLQIAVQAALDVASHVASDEHWEEPRTNQELFELFARHGWIDTDHKTRKAGPDMGPASGFRPVRPVSPPAVSSRRRHRTSAACVAAHYCGKHSVLACTVGLPQPAVA
jgi:hypothetical protein